jgi:coenzyme Q-binding protein COQ10
LPSFRTQRTVPFTPKEMFDVVADIERYPEFLPLCDSLVVKSRDEQPEGTTLIATMSVGYKAIRESFTTRVVVDPATLTIRVSYLDGPFSHLENEWRFEPANGGTTIQFFIDYAFRSPLLAIVVGAAFDKAVRSYTQAFEGRARAIYGERSVATITPSNQ